MLERATRSIRSLRLEEKARVKCHLDAKALAPLNISCI